MRSTGGRIGLRRRRFQSTRQFSRALPQSRPPLLNGLTTPLADIASIRRVDKAAGSKGAFKVQGSTFGVWLPQREPLTFKSVKSVVSNSSRFVARLEVGRLGRRRGRFDRAVATVILSAVRIKKKVKGQKQCL